MFSEVEGRVTCSLCEVEVKIFPGYGGDLYFV